MPRKLLKFLILFDNTSLLYFPGQFLTGRVLIELQDDTPALGLHFHVVGEGVVRVRTPRQERVYDRESYIDFRMRLLGEPGQGPSVLSPGIHSFPFKLGLPLGLPSTFLGKHGWIQYYCKTALREPNGLTHKNQQVFIVMNPIDLNLEPSSLGQAFQCEIEHKLGVTCVGSGPVACRVTLDRGGYVPGESIGVSASLHNRSRVTIKSTRAALTETIIYMARGKVVQSERRELASLTRGKIKPGERDEWTNEQLYVPPLPPTNLRGCHLIKIQYDVYRYNNYFKELLEKKDKYGSVDLTRIQCEIQQREEVEINLEEIKETIIKIKSGKSPGEEKITGDMLKTLSEARL